MTPLGAPLRLRELRRGPGSSPFAGEAGWPTVGPGHHPAGSGAIGLPPLLQESAWGLFIYTPRQAVGGVLKKSPSGPWRKR